MWINLLQIISLLGSLWLMSYSGCNYQQQVSGTSNTPNFDTLYTRISLDHKYGDIPPQQALPDSLTNYYLQEANKILQFTVLDTTSGNYKGYLEQKLPLTNDTYGTIVRFEPAYNGYFSLVCFLSDASNQVNKAVELSYAFSEEGARGEGDACFVHSNDTTKVFIKQYWTSYIDEDAVIDQYIDTIIAYQIQQQNIFPITLNQAAQKAWRERFTSYY